MPKTKLAREHAVSFGYKCAWLAVKAPPAAVLKALVGEPRRAGWQAGVAAAYEGSVFVTPAVAEWTLVVSTALFDEANSDVVAYVARVAKAVNCPTQLFATDRVIGLSAFVSVDATGNVVRAYCHDGNETVVNEGKPTAGEKKLGFAFGSVDDVDEEAIPDEEAIMAIAGTWSLDPQTLFQLPAGGEGWLTTALAI